MRLEQNFSGRNFLKRLSSKNCNWTKRKLDGNCECGFWSPKNAQIHKNWQKVASFGVGSKCPLCIDCDRRLLWMFPYQVGLLVFVKKFQNVRFSLTINHWSAFCFD